MREVTQEEFFAALKAQPNDIMPRIVGQGHPYTSEWRDQKSNFAPLWGKTVGKADGMQTYYLVGVE